MDIMELALLRSDSSALINNINSITGKNDTNLNNAIERLTEKYDDHTLEDALIQNTPMDEYYNDTVTEVGSFKFYQCMIKKISLPNVTTTLGQSAFNGNNVSLLEELYLPKCQTIGGYAVLDGNPQLKVVDYGFSPLGYMRNCPNLTTLVIRRTTVQNINSHLGLSGTPFSPDDGAGGYIYVPQDLISSYESHDGWSEHVNVIEFKPIEGSIYELTE